MNELLFISFALIILTTCLICFRLGKIYVFVLIALFSLLMNIFVTKQFTLFGFMVTGGNVLYGAVFLLTDLLSEHYGKKEALKAVGMGFLVVVLFTVSTQFLLLFQPNEFDFAQPALATLFSVTPRILFGSLLAYFIAQSVDVFLYHRIREFTKNRFLFLRNNGSTMVSQFIDTMIFTSVGLTAFPFLPFAGIIPLEAFWEVAIATYIIKLLVSAIDTPFIYLSHFLRPQELKQEIASAPQLPAIDSL